MTKINKALDYNKLLEDQAAGKLLKKHLSFPLIAHKKYDGNYVVIEVGEDYRINHTSGGLAYTHTDYAGRIFDGADVGYYLCERIHGEGKLGARNRCNLRGPKDKQTSTGHNYKVFGMVTHEEYDQGHSCRKYVQHRADLVMTGIPEDVMVVGRPMHSREQLDAYLIEVVKDGYEGLMLYDYDWTWKDTKSRKTSLSKYKKRRTADLLCIGTTKGEGKYEGLIGALVLQDSNGRVVSVGSGLSDTARHNSPSGFIGSVIEIEFEQIVDTYIQPTYIRVRDDKTKEEID